VTVILDISDAGPPKRMIVEQAFSECAMAGYEFGRTPEEVNDALARLNGMMAEWKVMRGIDLGYDQPPYGVGNADELSGIPIWTLNTVASHLALRVAPMMGAALTGEAKGNLSRSLRLLEAHYACIERMPRDSFTPRGLGEMHRRLYYGPFVDDAQEWPNIDGGGGDWHPSDGGDDGGDNGGWTP
jgi:hypothetical protein